MSKDLETLTATVSRMNDRIDQLCNQLARHLPDVFGTEKSAENYTLASDDVTVKSRIATDQNQHQVVIDDLVLGFGLIIVKGFATADEARKWNNNFFEKEGYPLSSYVKSQSAKPQVTILELDHHQGTELDDQGSIYMRRWYVTEGIGSDLVSLNLVGPMPNEQYLRGYARRDIEARRNDDWQQVMLVPGKAPVLVHHDVIDKLHNEENRRITDVTNHPMEKLALTGRLQMGSEDLAVIFTKARS